MYACLCACMFVCMCVCVHVGMYACMNKKMYECMCVCVCACVRVCVYESSQMSYQCLFWSRNRTQMHAPTGFGGPCAFRVLVPAIRMPFCTRSKTILHMHAFLSLVSRCTPLLALLRLERLRQPTFRASPATAVPLLTMALGLLRPLLTLLLRKGLLRHTRSWMIFPCVSLLCLLRPAVAAMTYMPGAPQNLSIISPQTIVDSQDAAQPHLHLPPPPIPANSFVTGPTVMNNNKSEL